MYIYFGAGMRSLADAVTGNVETWPAGQIFFWLGMVATIAVTLFITHIARKTIKQTVIKKKTQGTDVNAV